MIVSPNKLAAAGMSLGSKLDFFTVTTSVDLTVAANLNQLVETISINGQPVISALDTTAGTLKFAVEHTGAWTAAALATAILATDLFTGSTTTVAQNTL